MSLHSTTQLVAGPAAERLNLPCPLAIALAVNLFSELATLSYLDRNLQKLVQLILLLFRPSVPIRRSPQ